MKSVYFFCFTFFVTVRIATASEKCGTVDQARTAYKAGKSSKALKILNCIKKKNPRDMDARRLFSDIFYWEGAKGSARSEAEEALSISSQDPNQDPFDESRLHFMDRLSKLKFDGGLSEVSTQTSSGIDGALLSDYRYSDKGHVLFGAFHTARTYTGDVQVSDWHFSVGHVLVLNRQTYVENSFEYSPTAIISAKWAASLTPHRVLSDDSDLSLGLRINHYTTNTVYQVSPAWVKPLFSSWSLGLQFYSLFTYHWIFAGQLFAEHQFSSRVFSRVTLANGKAVEGPGLEDDFRSAAIAVGVKLSPTVSLIPNVGIYRAVLRNENTAGLGLELKL